MHLPQVGRFWHSYRVGATNRAGKERASVSPDMFRQAAGYDGWIDGDRRCRKPYPIFFILYVDNPASSADFYGGLLDRKPVFAAPTYVAFDLGAGFMPGLSSKASAAAVSGKGFELAFMVGGAEAVEDEYRRWTGLGIAAEKPFDAMLGRTFVAADADGTTLRACLADQAGSAATLR